MGWTGDGLEPMKRLAPLLGGLVTLGLAASGANAFEQHVNVAGSVQLDYLYVATEPPERIGFDGFTTELSLKMVADFGERTSAHVKVCYGCHGFEVAMAYLDFWVLDALSFRVGRMNPRFGDFPLRHDPANHRANSKPLPYDMGRMLRRTEWNNGIIPIPYADNGVEVYGTFWLGEQVSLDYAAHAVSGLEAGSGASDIDFTLSRSPALYYTDNNGRPAFGGRLSSSINLTEVSSLTIGASFMGGEYDEAGERTYTLVGADLHYRLHGLVLRAEVLMRTTEIDAAPAVLRFERLKDDDSFIKQGFYVEAEYPFTDWFEAFVRWDGLRRWGNLPASSPLRLESAVLRYTPGINLVLHRSIRVKLSAEFWDFSDFRDEVAVHAGVVGNF